MPQIRVSAESYRLLKERAKLERRTLSNMVEVLLIPVVYPGDSVPTVVTYEPQQGDSVKSGYLDEAKAPVFGLLERVPAPPAGSVDMPPTLETKVSVSPPFEPGEKKVELCTCGPGEKAKGKHNKWCPMRGK